MKLGLDQKCCSGHKVGVDEVADIPTWHCLTFKLRLTKLKKKKNLKNMTLHKLENKQIFH